MRVPGEVPRSALLRSDLWLALGVALLLVVGSDVALPDDLWAEPPDFAGLLLPGPAGLLLILVGTLPLAFRRIAPLPVLAVCVAASVVGQANPGPAPLPLGVLVALYTVAVMRRPLVCAAATIAYLVTLAVSTGSGWAPISDDLFYTYLVAVAAAVVLGYGVALGRARATLAEQRAAELSREQETRTQEAVKQEQARIAREVHDIVAHDVSVIVAQAASARSVLGASPKAAEQALASIEAVGRDALDGLRRVVWLLRTESADGDRTPQPAMDRIPWLLSQVRQAGLPVDLDVRGTPTPLPATVELNAYRIVQEALTNTLKHAGSTTATVTLDYGDDALAIEVRDHGLPTHRGTRGPVHRTGGAATRLPSTGYGLISMQQRASMLGGELVAGPADGDGFRVAARLPVTGSTR